MSNRVVWTPSVLKAVMAQSMQDAGASEEDVAEFIATTVITASNIRPGFEIAFFDKRLEPG